MRRGFRNLACGLLLAVTPALCWGASFNGVTYVDSGDIVLGRWNSQFTKAKAYAAENGFPLVVVWVNPGCTFCNSFERYVMVGSKVKAWMQARRYVFVFAINKKTSDAGAALAFINTSGGYPFCRAARPNGGGGTSFTARMSEDEFIKKVDGILGGSGSGSGSGSTVVTKKTYALTLTPSPSAGGKLSGAGSYESGRTVTVQAKASSDYVFAGWYSGSTLKSQATSYKVTMGSSASTLTGKFILKSADAVTALTCPLKESYEKGAKISDVAVTVAATSLASVKATGLPTGLSYSSSKGKIAGTPTRSGVFTSVVTAKTAGGAQKAVTNEVVVRASGEYVLRLACDAAAGKTSGDGVYAAGKRVSLRATPAKGHVFIGWYDGAARLSEAKTFAYVTTASDTSLTAKFTTAEEEEAAVTATVNGLPFGSAARTRSTNVVCGVAVSWPVAADGLTTTTASVSDLPSGLSYSARTGLVTGVPTRAQTKAVKIVATTANGTKVTYRLDVTVEPLPVWACGTYNGGGEDGLLTLTVSSSGKVSGKYAAGGTNWTLSAKSYTTYDAGKNAFGIEVLAKSGKAVLTNQVMVTGDSETLLGQATCKRFTGWWNGWKNAVYRDVATAIDRATNVAYQVTEPVPGTVKLSFGASGTVTAKGTFIVGKNARTGKDITYSASCSTVLCRFDESDNMMIFIYFAPKKNVFDGYAGCLELSFDGKNIFF